MGVALTHVLLSLDQENKKLNFQDFPEMLINICLAGMNFQLNGVFKTKNNLPKLDLSGADLRAAVFKEAELQEAILIKADLRGANLSKAKLQKANLTSADLEEANLEEAKLKEADLGLAHLGNACFDWQELQKCSAQLAKINANNFIKNIYPYWKKENDPEWAVLTEDKRMEAMQKFCNETEMRIFDESGKQQIMPPL